MRRLLTSNMPATQRRSSGNRRRTNSGLRKQQHLLDVTVRSHKATQQRNRMLAKLFFMIVVAAGLAGGAWFGGSHLLDRFLWNNPEYRLADLQTYTDGSLVRDDIIAAAQIRQGENIFAVKLSDARQRLSELPQVEFVEVTRTMPDRITIKIVERHPVAWVVHGEAEDPTTSSEAMLVDERGMLFQSREVRDEFLTLPVIYGADMDQLHPGMIAAEEELVAALSLLRLSASEPRLMIRAVDVSKRYCVVAVTRGLNRFTFGLERLDFQIDRLTQLFNYADGNQQEIQQVNLMVERNVPVVFAPLVAAEDGSPAAAPASAPRAAAPKVHKTAPAPTVTSKPRKEPEVRRALPVR